MPLGFECSNRRVGCYLSLTSYSILIFKPRFVNEVSAMCGSLPGVGSVFFINGGGPSCYRSYNCLAGFYSARPPTILLSRGSCTTVCFSSNAANFPGTVLREREDLINSYCARRGRRKRSESSMFLYVPPLCRANTGVR